MDIMVFLSYFKEFEYYGLNILFLIFKTHTILGEYENLKLPSKVNYV